MSKFLVIGAGKHSSHDNVGEAAEKSVVCNEGTSLSGPGRGPFNGQMLGRLLGVTLFFCLFSSVGFPAASDDAYCTLPSSLSRRGDGNPESSTARLKTLTSLGFSCPKVAEEPAIGLNAFASSCIGRMQKWRTPIKYYLEGWDVPYTEIDEILDRLSKASHIDVDWTFFPSRANLKILFHNEAFLRMEFFKKNSQEDPVVLSKIKALMKGEGLGCEGFARRGQNGIEEYVLYVSSERALDDQLFCINDALARSMGMNSSEILAIKHGSSSQLRREVVEAISFFYAPEIELGVSASDVVKKFCKPGQ